MEQGTGTRETEMGQITVGRWGGREGGTGARAVDRLAGRQEGRKKQMLVKRRKHKHQRES